MKNKQSGIEAKENAEWLIKTAQTYESNGDICAAKSWLLTAKSLFPRDFSIQYEEFLMERKAGKLQKCARLFYEMIHIFPKEKTLWEELSRIFHLQDGSSRLQNADNVFLKEMFDSLPENHQKELLLKYANYHTDLIDKCRISLLVLKRFKGAVKDQAVKLITTLKEAEDKESPNTPLNIYRKMIVCDILPLILKSSETQVVQQITKKKSGILFVTEEQMIQYIKLVTEFYVALAINKHGSISMYAMDPKSLEIDEAISPWNAIHENLVLFANKLNWSNTLKMKDKVDPAKNKPLRSRWKTLNNAWKDTKTPSPGVFFPLLNLHLLTVVEYCTSLLTVKKGSTDGIDREFVLLEYISHIRKEASSQSSVIKTPKKKKKTDDSGGYSSDYQSSSEDVTVVIHPGLIGKVNESLGDHLQVAIDTYNLLTSAFDEKFEGISHEWKMEKWDWMSTFYLDSLLYQGKYLKVMERLTGLSSRMAPVKFDLRLCCSLYCSGQRKVACTKALDIIATFPSTAFDGPMPSEERLSGKTEGRNLVIISNNYSDILTYLVNILFATLKNGLYIDGVQRDMVIGHLIVLCQLSWSKHTDFFLHLLKLIQAQDGGFKYSLFFSYVTQIDILEEFAHLHAGGTVQLVLNSPNEQALKRTVTRGVNKEVKEDFRTSLLRQVQKSHQSIHKNIFQFLREERESILKAI